MTDSKLDNSAPVYTDYTVLVADDQEGITTLISRVVQAQLGCTMRVASSGDEALAVLEREHADVFLTDMMMPGTHGLELVRTVRDRHPNTEILVMTGYPSEFPYVEVMNAGAVEFLNKPFPHAELEAKLIRLFKERELRRERELAERKYRSIFDMSADGMLLVSDTDFTVLDTNQALRAMCGKEAGALHGAPLHALFEENGQARLAHWMNVCAQSGGGTMADLVMPRAGAAPIAVDLSASFIALESGRIVFITLKDVTEKREIERELAAAAQLDNLTGLFNKRSFEHRIDWAIHAAAEQDTPVSLIMIDLDNFKACNDTHGHQVGDALLKSVGAVIKDCIRQGASDEGFRFGGDEFCVLLQHADADAAICVAQRLREKFDATEKYGTSMSIGVSEYEPGAPVDTFIRSADKALYKAKAAGKNTIHRA